jgi:hypothetical protein
MLKTLILGVRTYFKKTKKKIRYYNTFITNKMKIKYCKASILQYLCTSKISTSNQLQGDKITCSAITVTVLYIWVKLLT